MVGRTLAIPIIYTSVNINEEGYNEKHYIPGTPLSLSQVEESGRQRQLEAVDLFLETARAHLRTLTSGSTGGGEASALDPTN